MLSAGLKTPKNRFRPKLGPDPTGGAYTAHPYPIAGGAGS